MGSLRRGSWLPNPPRRLGLGGCCDPALPHTCELCFKLFLKKGKGVNALSTLHPAATQQGRQLSLAPRHPSPIAAPCPRLSRMWPRSLLAHADPSEPPASGLGVPTAASPRPSRVEPGFALPRRDAEPVPGWARLCKAGPPNTPPGTAGVHPSCVGGVC